MCFNISLRHTLNDIQNYGDIDKLQNLINKGLNIHDNFYSQYGIIMYFLDFNKIDPDIIEILLKNKAQIPPLNLKSYDKDLIAHVLNQNNCKLLNLLVNKDNCPRKLYNNFTLYNTVDYVLKMIDSMYNLDESIVHLLKIGLKPTESTTKKTFKYKLGNIIIKNIDNVQLVESEIKRYRKEHDMCKIFLRNSYYGGNMVVGAFGTAYKKFD